MQVNESALTDSPWGAVLLAFVLLLPRLSLRVSYPTALAALGGRRRWAGYFVGVAAANFSLIGAHLAGVRPWIEAVPIGGALLLSRVSLEYTFFVGSLVGWAVAACFSSPVAAWLGAKGRAHGMLLLALSGGVGVLVGALAALARPQPLTALLFSIASSVTLLVVVSLGFALGAGLPMRVRVHAGDAP